MGTGTIGKDGYHILWIDGRQVAAHRAIWQRAFGPLRSDWDVHHSDGNKLNNTVANLLALPRSEHTRLHHLESKTESIIQTRV
jgi:hypothetical protein